MRFGVRAGPVRVSAGRGGARYGAGVGPFWASGGGHRAARPKKPAARSASKQPSGSAIVLGLFAAVVLIGVIAIYWYIAVPVLAILALVIVMGIRADKRRQRAAQSAKPEDRTP